MFSGVLGFRGVWGTKRLIGVYGLLIGAMRTNTRGFFYSIDHANYLNFILWVVNYGAV